MKIELKNENYGYNYKKIETMGCGASQEPRITKRSEKDDLNFATLNYSSNSKTPFQFYSLDYHLQQMEIDEKVMEIIEQDKKINLKIVKIFDLYIKNRYSPLYCQSFGVKKCLFESYSQFQQCWLSQFQKQYAYDQFINVIEGLQNQKVINRLKYGQIKELKKQQLHQIIKGLDCPQIIHLNDEKSEKFVEQKIVLKMIIDSIRRYDYSVFQGILKFVYGTNSLDIIFQNRGVAKYVGFMQRFFQKPYLSQIIKEQRIINFVSHKNIDVLFLQNVTTDFCYSITKKMPEFRLKRGMAGSSTQNCNAAILYRPNAFRKAYDGKKSNLKFREIFEDNEIEDDMKKSFLKWQGMESAIESVGNFILISVDAKNKGKIGDSKEGNSVESKEGKNDLSLFTSHLNILRNKFPRKYIVLGGMFNQLLFNNDDDKLQSLHLQKYPNVQYFRSQIYATCHNQRTKMMSFKRQSDIQPQKKLQWQEQDLTVPTCKNFIIFPSRIAPQQQQILEREQNTVRKDSIKKGIYIAYQSDEQNQMHKLINQKQLKSYEHNKQMTMQKGQFGFLPNYKHPFNQYIVAINLKMPKRKEKAVDNQIQEQQDHDLQYKIHKVFDTSSSESDDGRQL